MTKLEKAKAFAKKHWKKLAVAGGAIVGIGIMCAVRKGMCADADIMIEPHDCSMTLGDLGKLGEAYINGHAKCTADTKVVGSTLYLVVDD